MFLIFIKIWNSHCQGRHTLVGPFWKTNFSTGVQWLNLNLPLIPSYTNGFWPHKSLQWSDQGLLSNAVCIQEKLYSVYWWTVSFSLSMLICSRQHQGNMGNHKEIQHSSLPCLADSRRSIIRTGKGQSSYTVSTGAWKLTSHPHPCQNIHSPIFLACEYSLTSSLWWWEWLRLPI